MSFDLNEEKLKLVNLVCASLFSEPRFNQEKDTTAKLINELVANVASKDPEFILKLALYVRDDLNIRTTANYLLALAANTKECTPFLKKYYHKAVRLPSDWLDVAALYQLLPSKGLSDKAIPTSLRKAMSQKFIQFDAYQLAKYNKENTQKRKRKKAKKLAEKLALEGKPVPPPVQKQITLKQMIRQLHISQPVPHVMCILGKKYPTNMIAFRDSGLNGQYQEDRAGKRMKLPVPETWETVISSKGNCAEAWEELIDNRKLPFMALLRNLRNLILSGVSEKHHRWVMSRLKDEKTVANSRQFPFSFFTAYEAIDVDIPKLTLDIAAAIKNKGQPKVKAEKKKKKGDEPKKKEKKVIIPKNMPTPELIARYKEALDMAVKYSTVHNVKPIRGTTVVFANTSAGMVSGALSGRKIGRVKSLVEVGILLGLMCKYVCEECDFQIVSHDHKSIELIPGNILDNMSIVMNEVTAMNANGGSFSFPHNYFDNLILERKKIDNFLFFSSVHDFHELEAISLSIKKYRQEINPKLLFVKVNLSSAKSALSSDNLFSNPNDVEISGFSDAILRYVAEKGDGNQLDYIQHIDIVKNLEALTAKLDMRFNKSSYDSKPSQCWSFLDKVQNCKFEGCQVKLPKDRIAEHFTTCPYRIVKCSEPNCAEMLPFNQLEIHFTRCLYKQSQNQKAKKWRNVRVFISSTFLDMHGERDVLTRFVFPEIREYCKSRKINFFEVDLRWGLVDEDGEKGSPLDVCLSEVEKCRPFFIGILGDRYGWVPEHYKVSEDPNFSWLKSYPAGRSITELEFYHGVLRNPETTGTIFVRDSSLLNEIPDNYRNLFTSNAEDQVKLQNLKNEIYSKARYVNYSANWGGVVDGKPVATNLDNFRSAVTQSLKQDIDRLFPFGEEEPSLEKTLHDDFLESKSRRFVGRKDLLAQMFKYADGDNNTPLVIYGKPGFGKSSLVAKFAKDYQEKRPGSLVFTHFVGAAPGSTDIRHTLARICTELKSHYMIKEEIPETYKELKASFPRFLEQSMFGSPLILVIDSINQFSEVNRPHALEWLPATVPVKIILSTYVDTPSFEALRHRQPELPMIEVGHLPENDRKELVRQALFEYRKKLEETPSNNQMRLLLRKPDGVKPLWLFIACEELRNFGIYEQVSDKIKSLGNNVTLLLTQIITRFEKDYGKELVSAALSLIACSRNGLSEVELLSLLAGPGESSYPRAKWASFYRAIESYLKFIGNGEESYYTFFHGDMFEVVNKLYLKSNDQQINAHKKLARFYYARADPTKDQTFNTSDRRAISELPYHLHKAKLIGELEQVLCNLSFMNTKVSMGFVFELAADLQNAVDISKKDSGFSIFEDENPVSTPLEECLRFITSNSYILSQVSPLLFQQAINQPTNSTPCLLAEALWSERKIATTWLNWKNKPTSFDACKLTLAGYADTMTACAFSPDGKRMVSASRDRTLKIFETASGKEIATLFGHSNCVSDCAYSPDGREIVSASWDNTLKLWDAEVGTEICTLTGHTRKVSSCVYSNDGRFVLSGSWDFNMILWSTADRKQVAIYKSHIKPINSCAFSPDDKFLISGAWDATVKLWDRENVTCLKTFIGHSNSIRSVAFAPNGRQIVSTSSDCTIRVWNVDNETFVAFHGHSKPVNSCAFSEDGKYLISASDDQTIKVWDALGGSEKSTMKMGSSFANAIAVSADGKKFATANNDCTVTVWDVISATPSEPLEGHTLCVNAIKFAPNKRELATVSDDKTAIIWDLDNNSHVVLSGHTDRVKSVAYHPVKRILVTASDDFTALVWNLTNNTVAFKLSASGALQTCNFSPDGQTIITGGKDGVLSFWNSLNGKLIHSFKAHNDWITSAAYSNCGTKVATCSWDFTAKIWDAQYSEIYKCTGHTGSLTSLAWSPDNKRLVTTSSDNSLRIWSVTEKVPITSLDGHKMRVNACAWHEKFILSCGEDGLIKSWDAQVGAEITSLEGHSDTIRSVALSRDKTQIISASEDCTVKVWDAKARKEISSHSKLVNSCSFDSTGKLCVSSSLDSTINLWSADSYRKLNIYNTDSDNIRPATAVAILPHNNDFVAFGNEEGVVGVWNHTLDEVILTRAAHSAPITSIKASSLGNRVILATASWDNSIRLWDVGNPRKVTKTDTLNFHTNWVNCVDISRSGEYLLSASHDSTVRLTKLNNTRHSNPVAFDNWVLSCAFSADSNKFIVGTYDRKVGIYDSRTLQLTSMHNNHHTERINGVSFVGDNYFISASSDRTVKLWDTRQNGFATSFFTKGAATTVSAFDSSICVGDSLGNVYFFDVFDKHSH